MGSGLSVLRAMEYPGRVIIIGKSLSGDDVVMYAITGRSPSSQARRLEVDDSHMRVFVKPTDEDTLKRGRPELLIYSAILIEQGIGVGNGTQTEDLRGMLLRSRGAAEVLVESQSRWTYEPDEPNFTPRITGCIVKDAALCLIKRAADGTAVRQYFEVPLIAGKGRMIATYTGVNVKPLPSFSGEPLDVDIVSLNAQECARAMYEALAPRQGQPDYRVAATAVYVNAMGQADIAVKNRHDRSSPAN